MGFNSVLLVLNDRLHEIEHDPEFGKKVARAIRAHSWPGEQPYITGQTQVLSVHHADTLVVVAVGGNTGRVIGHGHWTQNDDQLVRHLEQERRRKEREAKASARVTA